MSALGLIRVENGLVVGGPYIVEPAPDGTVVGALALEEGAVTDVGPDVSARHLRIYAKDGAWYAQDLGSTNGTRLIRRSTHAKIDIGSGSPAQLQPYDVLCLGLSTAFAVVAVSPNLIDQRNQMEVQ